MARSGGYVQGSSPKAVGHFPCGLWFRTPGYQEVSPLGSPFDLERNNMLPKVFIMIAAIGFILPSFACHADTPGLTEAKETVQEMGLKFARCSGVYAAVSEVHTATNAPTLAKDTKEKSNGAWAASSYLLFSAGIIPDWKKAMAYAENTASSTRLSYIASFEKTDANQAMDELTDAMKECNKSLKLQEKLVQEVRLKFYSQSTQ